MAPGRSLRDSDWMLQLVALLICAIGVVQIYSATHDTVWQGAWWRQLAYVAAGLAVMWLVSAIDYHALLDHVPLLYVTIVALLVAVLIIGVSVSGGRRWIPLIGGVNFQASEFAKLAIILLVARFLTGLKSDRLGFREFLKLAGLAAIPAALVVRQPDLGTALTYVPVVLIGAFLAKMPWRYWAALLVVGAGVSWVSYAYALKDYQRARLESFWNPEADPRGSGYQVVQSKIAIGSGGIRGRGVAQGSQTQLRFLPVPHTDFIFATFGEEHGFVGVVAVLLLYLWLLMQIVQNAQAASDRAGMYICMGVAALLLFHLLVNVGMVVGLMPVTGIPLPLMSFGGSSTLSVFLMLGLVNSVRLRRFVN